MFARGVVKTKKKSITKSQRANVIFPVSRLHRFLKEFSHKYRIGVGAAVYTASVIEYLAAEVLELAGNTARDSKKSRITPRHILFAVATDKELHELLKNVTIASGGVIPYIHPNLLKKKIGNTSLPLSPVPSPKGIKTTRSPIKKANLLNKKKAAMVQLHVQTKGKGKGAKKGAFTILSEKKLHLGQKLRVVSTDIADIKVDAIVHPTNGSFALAGQVGQTLQHVGGKKLVDEVNKLQKEIGTLGSCDAAMSAAVNLPSSWIIHVNGPSHLDINAYDKLEKAVRSCLSLADLKNLKSVAMPSIGSGSAGFPKQQAAQTILKAIKSYFVDNMSSSLKDIYFVLYDAQSITIYTTEMAKLDP